MNDAGTEPPPSPVSERQTALARRLFAVRAFSERLVAPLAPEDCVIQSMPDVSPTRWHLAHTTWFFETFVLKRQPGYQLYDEHYEVLFNSYYNSVGEQFPRAQRGLLSRPTVAEVLAYRQQVDASLRRLLECESLSEEVLSIIELGLHHEQQHQELMLTDIKHVLSCNPLFPVYDGRVRPFGKTSDCRSGSTSFAGGLVEIGFDGNGFAYDNESPRHRVFLEPFALSNQLVTAGEYLEFMQDGGYRRPELWLSLGWSTVEQQAWQTPLYWHFKDGIWYYFTLAGLAPVDLATPVCHVSYFEADAYARWAGARLPTEAEWELASQQIPIAARFADNSLAAGETVHPSPNVIDEDTTLAQMFGTLWQWTASAYSAYPGYAPPPGAIGEYNGKFMCNQYVLRGGSCATPSHHIRRTYRNFFPPDTRWQFSGIRLAKG